MKLKGSMTVEAAGLIPVVFLVVFSMLYLCFFVHNRVFLTAAACESAVCGSLEEAMRCGGGYEAAHTRSIERGNTGFYGAANLSAGIRTGDRTLVVWYAADTTASGFSIFWPMSAEGKAVLLHPAQEIREKKPYRTRRKEEH